MKRIWLLPTLLFVTTSIAFSQNNYAEFYSKSLSISNAGMYILGGWALTNILSGAAGWNYSEGTPKYFYQMNVFWNIVNLSIAGFALYNNITFDYTSLTSDAILTKQLKTQNLYLINAGLDTA